MIFRLYPWLHPLIYTIKSPFFIGHCLFSSEELRTTSHRRSLHPPATPTRLTGTWAKSYAVGRDSRSKTAAFNSKMVISLAEVGIYWAKNGDWIIKKGGFSTKNMCLARKHTDLIHIGNQSGIKWIEQAKTACWPNKHVGFNCKIV